MPTVRAVLALSGLLLALLAVGTTAGTAASSAASTAAEPDAARALPCKEPVGKHRVCASGKEIGDTNRFVAYGKVPTYKGRTIKLQRRNCGTCPWKFYKRTDTNKRSGWFRTRIYPGKVGSRVCYRVVVPKTSKYRTTRVRVGCIRTRAA